MELSSPARSASTRGHGLGFLARRPAAFLAIAILITALLSLGIVGVKPLGIRALHAEGGIDLLANSASPRFADQVLFANSFGSDPIVVMVEARPGAELITGNHFIGLAALEGALADRHLSPGVKKVYGPGTVVNTLALEVTRRGIEICAAEAKAVENQAAKDAASAGKSVRDQQAAGQAAFDSAARACATDIAAKYPGLGVPALNNKAFVQQVLLEPDGTRSRPYWSWALPDPRHALITVRMEPHASLSDVRHVLATVDRARHRHSPAAPPPAGARGSGTTTRQASEVTTSGDLSDLRLTVTGAPALTLSLADSVQGSLIALLPWTLLAMLLVTFLVLRVPMRVLAVPIAGLAAFWTAGAAGWAGLPITPATMAVLPVVLGLSTDYVLQALNRLVDEDTGGPTGRVARAAVAILPPTAVAALATIAGVMAFAVSPLPLVRQFALFLAIGVAMAYLAAMLVGFPLFSLVMSSNLRRRFAGTSPKPFWRGLASMGRLPLAGVLPLILLGVVGWSALPRLGIETDPARLMPRGDPALAQAEHVRHEVGLAGEIDLVMVGPAVASPDALNWLKASTEGIARREPAALREETSLPSFLAAFNQGQVPDSALTKT
ncbi:MAG: MMPL family transporter, partial [Candidatus Dormibacteraeota bacterium]|nr:MMPL family transporter [Candidatus Dormibacteraeota bacterium]